MLHTKIITFRTILLLLSVSVSCELMLLNTDNVLPQKQIEISRSTAPPGGGVTFFDGAILLNATTQITTATMTASSVEAATPTMTKKAKKKKIDCDMKTQQQQKNKKKIKFLRRRGASESSLVATTSTKTVATLLLALPTTSTAEAVSSSDDNENLESATTTTAENHSSLGLGLGLFFGFLAFFFSIRLIFYQRRCRANQNRGSSSTFIGVYFTPTTEEEEKRCSTEEEYEDKTISRRTSAILSASEYNNNDTVSTRWRANSFLGVVASVVAKLPSHHRFTTVVQPEEEKGQEISYPDVQFPPFVSSHYMRRYIMYSHQYV